MGRVFGQLLGGQGQGLVTSLGYINRKVLSQEVFGKSGACLSTERSWGIGLGKTDQNLVKVSVRKRGLNEKFWSKEI